MKKTVGLIIMLIVMLVALTGCAKVNYEVKVNKDGSGEITYIYGVERNKIGNSNDIIEEFVRTMKEQAEKSGYNVELYENDEISGFKANKHIEDINKDFSLEEAFGKEYVKDTENNKINIEKSFLITKYSQNTELDLTNFSNTNVEMTYKIKLPTKVKISNANSISKNGKELTWNLRGGESYKITFEAEQINILSIVVIAVVVILIVVAIIFIILKKKHVTKNEK